MPDTAALHFAEFPLQPADFTASLGATVVVAPHPDDESLGCGGLLALLRRAGQPVHTVLVSDGTMSHPNSLRFPAPARRALREAELREALEILGVETAQTLHMGLPDGAVPTAKATGFAAAVEQLSAYLEAHQPQTLLVPWRRDPHPDHRATSQLVHAACARLTASPRLLEYVVWAWERADPAELPQPSEVRGWRLDISSVVALKQQAIAAHRSQLLPIIDDDPAGFQLSEGMLAHFAQPFEVYLEAV
ncbi:N-acetylglucosaminyl deacetylase, LmbE family [Hymenobacter daecheongensis DSM 21074]|uniref:N-acetylglucosaminyl deacetylase, LmbE family n=1 Tax=Hymenobacter daecheongensis DSM 21074 TaxID=1121955 RepID=A0A1M6MKS3_9BACT|nr:PIG-L deacetylase family protein [Hymenobacter daecheongensis]SHJ83996.1 N-acetylglucosaminyl deacetylase, LmbE family [Hymenobacter daecheongensis DSM 21074]